MLRLALIGDLHVHERSPRFQHVLDVLDWTLRDAAEQGAAEYVFLGDLCEGAPSPREYAELQWRLRGSVTQGNHEHAETGLMFDGPGRIVAWDRFRTINFPEARLLLIPYPRRGRPPFDDLTHDGSIADSMRAAAAEIAYRVHAEVEDLGGTKPLIVCGHFTIEGMTAGDSEFEVHSATEVVVPRAAFDGCALVAVGHIHKAQEFCEAPGCEGWYGTDHSTALVHGTPSLIGVGSLIRHSFAEADDSKSYTLVTVDQGRVTWERRPVPAREMLVAALEWPTGSPTDAFVKVCAGKEVKLTIEICEDALSTFDPRAFDPIREVAAYFLLERITLSPERTRAPRLTRASSLAEQFAAWAEATDLDLTDARRGRLMEKIGEMG